MTTDIPHCPNPLPGRLRRKVNELAHDWITSRERPDPRTDTLLAWDRLLHRWLKCVDLPLLVRKGSLGRGSMIRHASGQELVPVDNSAAHWSFLKALKGECPSLEEVARAFREDSIPVAMVLKKEEQANAKYQCTRNRANNRNALGWKLAHINPVSLRARGDIVSTQLQIIQEHFLTLMAPANMFLVPKLWSGLGETQEMISAIKELRNADGLLSE